VTLWQKLRQWKVFQIIMIPKPNKDLVNGSLAYYSSNFKKIIAYSSINQIAWIYLIILISSKLWLIYLCFYSISILIVTNVIKIIYPLTINNWININLNLKLLRLIIIINISGLPPFRLFFIKWYRVILIISSIKFNIIVIIILLRSVAILYIYIYINILIKSSLIHSLNTKLINYKIYYIYQYWIVLFILLSLIMLII